MLNAAGAYALGEVKVGDFHLHVVSGIVKIYRKIFPHFNKQRKSATLHR